MEEAKETLLSELYAIRATMSLVSEKDDSAEPTRTEIMGRNKSIKNIELDLSRENRQYDENRKWSERRRFDISREIDDCNKDINKKQTEIETYKKNVEYWRNKKPSIRNNDANAEMPFGFWIAFGIIFFVGLLSLVLLFTESKIVGEWIISIISVTLVIMLLVRYLYLTSIIRKNYSQKLQYNERDKRDAENSLSGLQNKVSELKRQLSETERAIQSDEAEQRLKIESRQKEIQRVQEEIPPYEQKLTEIGLESQAIIDCAKETYRAIDYRDWGNVDLLIFYFETGRADSLKEALQLVDRQQQTDEIVSAIEYASKAISMTIESSVKKLGQALALSFDRLSAQLSKQHRELMNSSEKQRLQQEAILGKFDELNSNMQGISENMDKSAELQMISQQMQTSLLQKIDRSSADLKEDMEKQLRYVHGIYY